MICLDLFRFVTVVKKVSLCYQDSQLYNTLCATANESESVYMFPGKTYIVKLLTFSEEPGKLSR